MPVKYYNLARSSVLFGLVSYNDTKKGDPNHISTLVNLRWTFGKFGTIERCEPKNR